VQQIFEAGGIVNIKAALVSGLYITMGRVLDRRLNKTPAKSRAEFEEDLKEISESDLKRIYVRFLEYTKTYELPNSVEKIHNTRWRGGGKGEALVRMGFERLLTKTFACVALY
jgi:hypothetical protein